MTECSLDTTAFILGIAVSIIVPFIFYKVTSATAKEENKWVPQLVAMLTFIIMLFALVLLSQVCGGPLTPAS